MATDRYIQIDPALLKPLDVYEPPNPADTIDLKVAYQVNKANVKACNMQLAEIAKQGQP